VTEYSIEAARASLGELITLARAGQTVILTNYRKPVARLIPVEPTMTTAQLAALVGTFDVIEVTDDVVGYDPEDIGKLAVQRAGAWIAFAEDLADAASIIGRETGVKVTLTEADNYFSGRLWLVS